MGRVRLSVVVPAHNAPHQLELTLPALLANDLPRDEWELIVVDDASQDDTPLVAARYADTVVRLRGMPNGPGYARNRGAEVSRGDILVFVDADVRLYPDALRHIVNAMDSDPEVSAIFGSYDASPADPGLVSQYRNLLHHYVHQSNAGDAETFWAGLGAIRRDVFIGVGMFDEWHYSRPQIEDIELGRRMRMAGHKIVLRPEIQATHLKRWTLISMLRTDFRHRGVPWMWLVLKEGDGGQKTLNLRVIERVCTALTGLALAGGMVSVFLGRSWPLLVSVVALSVVIINSRRFYGFLWSRKGLWFMLCSIGLHLLYYFMNGVSAIAGWLVHTLFGKPRPSAEVDALAQLGLKKWPPGPEQPRFSVWNQDE